MVIKMRNKKGNVVLNNCEICAGIGKIRKLTDEEKETYGHICQECVDDLRKTLDNALKGK